jgi:hypothetical protein
MSQDAMKVNHSGACLANEQMGVLCDHEDYDCHSKINTRIRFLLDPVGWANKRGNLGLQESRDVDSFFTFTVSAPSIAGQNEKGVFFSGCAMASRLSQSNPQKMTIPAHYVLFLATGNIIPPSLFKSIEPQHQIYIAQLNKNLNVDWSPGASGFNFPAYMNSACGGEKLNCRTQLFYHQGEMFMAIITTRIISFGEELTWNYGKHRVFECPCGYEDCKSKTKSRRR